MQSKCLLEELLLLLLLYELYQIYYSIILSRLCKALCLPQKTIRNYEHLDKNLPEIIENNHTQKVLNLFFRPHFYFVSDSSEVIDLLSFFSHSSPFFSNLQNSAILLIFLYRTDGSLLKYDMMILLFWNLSGFRIFSGFFKFLPDFFKIFSVLTMFI